MVSAEVALALPALVIVVAALVTVIVAVTAQLRCVAAAREGARAAARGESAAVVQQVAARAAPDGANVNVATNGADVTVEVRAVVHPLGIRMTEINVAGTATALLEPQSTAATASGISLGSAVLAWLSTDRRRVRRHRLRHDERGSGTVYAVAMLGVLTVLIAGGALLAKAHVAQQRAAAAADLGALAGAQALLDGTDDPCAAAARIVHRNDAQLAECVIDGETIIITSAVAVSLGGLGVHEATARARAGPVPD